MGGASSANEEADMIPMVINGKLVENDSRNGMFLKERGAFQSRIDSRNSIDLYHKYNDGDRYTRRNDGFEDTTEIERISSGVGGTQINTITSANIVSLINTQCVDRSACNVIKGEGFWESLWNDGRNVVVTLRKRSVNGHSIRDS